jgi:hypothetical protein
MVFANLNIQERDTASAKNEHKTQVHSSFVSGVLMFVIYSGHDTHQGRRPRAVEADTKP